LTHGSGPPAAAGTLGTCRPRVGCDSGCTPRIRTAADSKAIRLGFASSAGPTPMSSFTAQKRCSTRRSGSGLSASFHLPGTSSGSAARPGRPDLAAVTRLEIHADTWEAGFSLWFDGFSFDVPIQPPEGLRAYAGNHVVTLQWKSYLDPAQAINVYRSFFADHERGGDDSVGNARSRFDSARGCDGPE
jgi:hypothetical protein